MDITLIAVVSFLLLSIGFLFLYLSNSIKKKSFVADDGSVFENQSDLEVYQSLYERINPLFTVVEDKSINQPILGFDKSFLIKLTTEGFQDLKTLVKYRSQLKSLSDMINS